MIEEVIDAIKMKLNPEPTDYVSLSGSDETQVWAEANQYSLTPGNNRLILIRDADKLSRWQHLTQWLARARTMPGVHLVFVSNDTDLPHTKTGGKKTLKPHVAALKAPRGHLIKCTQPNENDALAWVRRRARLDEPVARYLLTRVGGDLTQAAAVCTKLSLFDARAGAATINALVDENPQADFTDSLIALDKRQALLHTDTIGYADQFGLLALLDSRLDLLHKLHRLQIAGRNWHDVTGISPFLTRRYLPHARHYNPAACTQRRRLLASIEHALRSGARIGTLETLVALW